MSVAVSARARPGSPVAVRIAGEMDVDAAGVIAAVGVASQQPIKGGISAISVGAPLAVLVGVQAN